MLPEQEVGSGVEHGQGEAGRRNRMRWEVCDRLCKGGEHRRILIRVSQFTAGPLLLQTQTASILVALEQLCMCTSTHISHQHVLCTCHVYIHRHMCSTCLSHTHPLASTSAQHMSAHTLSCGCTSARQRRGLKVLPWLHDKFIYWGLGGSKEWALDIMCPQPMADCR